MSDDRPAPNTARAGRDRRYAAAALGWPPAAAVGCWVLAAALTWAQQHGAPLPLVAEAVVPLLRLTIGFLLVAWLYVLLAAAGLARTGLSRGRRRLLANLFPAACFALLWTAAGRTRRDPSGGGNDGPAISAADLPFLVPASLVAEAVPTPTFVSPCDVSFWDLARSGFRPDIERAVELSDGSVLLSAKIDRGDAPAVEKLGRLTAAGAPDRGFTLDRRCTDAEALVAGPAGTFSERANTYVWGPRDPTRRGQVELTLAWRDTAGRALGRSPFPADRGALPPWTDRTLGRPTPAGFVLAGWYGPLADSARLAPRDSASVTVVRVLADGRYDPAFTPWTLRATPAPGGGGAPAPELAQLRGWPDGSVLVLAHELAGGDSLVGRLVRLGADGRPDTSFARRAAAALAPYSAPAAVTVDAAGRLVLALYGNMASDSATSAPEPAANLVRLLPSGALDASFRTDALRRRIPDAVYAQPSGHVVLFYSRTADGDHKPWLDRADPSGRLDAQFRARMLRSESPVVPLLVRRDGAVVATEEDDVVLLAPDGRELRRTAGHPSLPALLGRAAPRAARPGGAARAR